MTNLVTGLKLQAEILVNENWTTDQLIKVLIKELLKCYSNIYWAWRIKV